MATAPSPPEFWLRGPVDGVDPILMPAAHALLQTVEDVERAVAGLSPDHLWQTPGGAASIGFHLLHLSGATDRLLTYARGERLDDRQKAALAAENDPPRRDAAALLAEFRATVDAALAQIRATSPSTALEARTVGRAALPTTVLGLIVHAAEHSQRHAGQVITTAKILRGA
ncbi:MAG TPA: DinB family protein [Vicinamibacterales bacterium]|nr:DinB family protein [Vicinamibacterales bacterium]